MHAYTLRLVRACMWQMPISFFFQMNNNGDEGKNENQKKNNDNTTMKKIEDRTSHTL